MKKFLLILAILTLVLAFLFAIFAEFLANFDPNSVNLESANETPNSVYIFGSDLLGRDIYSRLIFAFRVSLFVGFCSAFLSLLFGILYAFLAKITPLDTLLMGVIDMILALPLMLIVMFFSAVLNHSVFSMIFIISVSMFAGVARVLRSEFEKLFEADFVREAVVLGASKFSIVFREILPNTLNILVVLFATNFAHAIATEAVLSFFGIGISLSTPSLGNMLNEAKPAIFLEAWQMLFFPGISIFLISISLYFIANFLEQR